MKIIGAIMVAELRGNRALALVIITLFALLGMTQTHWLYETTPFIAICLQALLLLLVVLVLSKSLWQDAPLRKERYLATRPTNMLKLYVGKYAAFLLMIAVPSALAEFLRVRYFSFELNIQAAAASQMFLIYASAIAAFIAVIWWMHSKKGIVMMWVSIVAAGIASNYYFWHLPQSYIKDWSAGVPYSPYMIMLMLASFAMMANLRLLRLKKCNAMISCVLMAVIVFVSMHLSIQISTRKRFEGTEQKCHLVNVSSVAQQQSKMRTIRVAVPHVEIERDTLSHWSFQVAQLNGKDYTPWYFQNLGYTTQLAELVSAIHQRYPLAKIPERKPSAIEIASVSVPQSFYDKGIDHMKFVVTQKILRWKIVMDIPLQNGAKANYSHFSCHIAQLDTNAGNLLATVAYCNPMQSNLAHLNFSQEYRFVIVDPSTGETFANIQRGTYLRGRQLVSSYDFYDVGDYILPNDISFQRRAYPKDARVLILVPEIIEEKMYQWENAQSLQKHAYRSIDWQKGNALGQLKPEEWTRKNPAPSLQASLAERENWVNQFIDYAKQNPQAIRNLGYQHEMMKAYDMHLGLFAKAHHEDRLPEEMKGYQFVHKFTRDMMRKYPNLGYSPYVIWEFHSRGWSADLVDLARDMLRRGQGSPYVEIILAEPKLMNLTQDEWIDFFRLNRNAQSYKALKDIVLPASTIDPMVDQILTLREDVDLALARGHPRATHWLKREYSQSDETNVKYWYNRLIAHFDLTNLRPRASKSNLVQREPLMEWLDTFDPDAYVYDSAKQKYILKPTP